MTMKAWMSRNIRRSPPIRIRVTRTTHAGQRGRGRLRYPWNALQHNARAPPETGAVATPSRGALKGPVKANGPSPAPRGRGRASRAADACAIRLVNDRLTTPAAKAPRRTRLQEETHARDRPFHRRQGRSRAPPAGPATCSTRTPARCRPRSRSPASPRSSRRSPMPRPRSRPGPRPTRSAAPA